jgi:hypothetical protein
VGLVASMARKRTSALAETEPKPDAPPPEPIRAIPDTTVRDADGTVTVTERGLGVLEAGAAAGAGTATLAALLGVSRATLRSLRDRQPAVDEAVSRGQAAEEQLLVSILRRSAAKGYAPAAMFLLKARHGYRETSPVAPPEGARTTNVFMVPSMSPEQFRSIVEGTATPVADATPPKELTHGTASR